jgi:SAM-dependent methyltransferase
MPEVDIFSQEFWDERYSHPGHVWSGRPNAQLVAHVQDLAPGRAIDVGCGEGGDAIWLAHQGWTVTGVDISPIGLAKAAAHAQESGAEIAGRIEWEPVDLYAAEMEPLGSFDLVNSQYLHMPPDVRDRAFARLAAAVAPGGHLLLASHHPSDLSIPGLRPDRRELFYTPEELVARLDPAGWEILVAAAVERDGKDRDGRPVIVRDTVLFARRRVS